MLSVHIRHSENMTNQKHINQEQYGLFAISDTKTRVFSCMLGNKKKMAITLTRSLTFFCMHLSVLSLKDHVPLSVFLGISSSHCATAQAHKCMRMT